MNVLLTGASGFVGGYLYNELVRCHTVTTLGRTPLGSGHIVCDLSKVVPNLTDRPLDWVVNAAGKAHSIPHNKAEWADYEATNVQGTTHLLTALEQLAVRPAALVHISTVLVYGRSHGELLDERTSLDANDPYGLSKIRAEAAVREWGHRTGVRTTILRLALVAGNPPNGNLAKMKNAIRRGYYVRMGRGDARRSMVRADDVAAILAQAAEVGGIFNLTDGRNPTVRAVEDALARQVGRHKLPVVPLALARGMALVGDGINAVAGRRFPLDSSALEKLTGSLTFSDEAARKILNWNPRPVLDLYS